MLWGKIHAYLLHGPRNVDAAELRHLQESDIALLRLSTAHVSEWQIDTVVTNWAAYCDASRALRGKMSDALQSEMRLLYPLLETGRRP
jgi:hypothetical protein